MMDPNWVSVVIGILSSIITAILVAAVNYAALKAWMATREVNEKNLLKDVEDHEDRLRELEREVRPFDIPVRR